MKLRESQRVALERLCEDGRTFAALWAQPRTGKTAVALKWIEHLHPKVALIVGPKVAEGVWRTEAAKWLKCDYRFYPLTSGNEYPSFDLFKGVTLLFVNYDQFAKSPFKRLKPFLQKVAKWCDFGGAMLLDESHMIKSPSAITGRNIRPLAKQWKYRLLMTGTPVTNPNQVDAVYGQWTFLDPSIRDHWETARTFREHFGEWTNVKGFPELIRPRNQYGLNKYLEPNIITMTGVADPVPIKRATYTPTEDVAEYLKTLKREGVVKIHGHTVAALNPLTRLLRMRQLISGWCTDDKDQSFVVKNAKNKRLKVLRYILKRTRGKVIITCTHLYEITLVSKFLTRNDYKHLIITGKTEDKNFTIAEFQSDPECKVLLVQPRTVAMAVDISVANDLIWYSSDFNYVTFAQASDRIKLSPANPQVWFICAKGTVDEDVWITLRKDHNHLKKILRRMRQGEY